jgi:hypothetical protein
MSLLRQRATDRSAESTLSARSPAFARLRFVKATRSASDDALNDSLSQPKVRDGLA